MVVVFPSDYQVDPREFAKYRMYYRSQSEFDKWNQQIPALASMMNALEEYIAGKLKERGFSVVRFSQVAAEQRAATALFDRGSHHLTPAAHRMLSAAVLRNLEGTDADR